MNIYVRGLLNDREPLEIYVIGLIKEQRIITSLLVFTWESIFIIPDMTLDEKGLPMPSNGSKKIDNLQWFDIKFSKENLMTQMKHRKSSSQPNSKEKIRRKVRRVDYNDITEIHRQRYWLKPMGIEFFEGALSFFFITRLSQTSHIYSRFIYYVSDKKSIFSLQNQNKIYFGFRNLNHFSKIFSHSKILKIMGASWKNGLISNFEYLLILNILSGRTNNDMSQYPVMPWIISNYEKDQLDLEDESNFRDLSRPVGALTLERVNFVKQKFIETTEIQGKG
jgi:Beige/BEACH domain